MVSSLLTILYIASSPRVTPRAGNRFRPSELVPLEGATEVVLPSVTPYEAHGIGVEHLARRRSFFGLITPNP